MSPALAPFTWTALDGWIVVVAALAAASCALLGCFLVLRRQSMMGDAISHAVLPGLAAAFLLTGSRNSTVMLAGAAVVGVLTAFLTEWIHRAARVEKSAAMGVVFTILFAIGLILIRQAADRVDLDPDCVLYGAIETTPLYTLQLGWGGWALNVPQAVLTNGVVLLVNLLLVGLLFKEFTISTFDPALATSLGISAAFMHYLLMTLVAVTTVVAFESVGSILVIAMLIVPAASARLLTDRLAPTLLLAAVLAVAAAGLGHLGALLLPGWLGFRGASAGTAGMIGVAAGLLFAAAMLFAPRHGVVSRAAQRALLALRIVRDDLLGSLYRTAETGHPLAAAAAPTSGVLGTRVGGSPVLRWLALRGLRRRGLVQRDAAGVYGLTPAGATAAAALVRAHRLWETYLGEHLAVPPDHLHRPAEHLEHVTDRQTRERLAASLGGRGRDPHGAPIPPAD